MSNPLSSCQIVNTELSKINFSAGPAKLPESVSRKVFKTENESRNKIVEMSHRSNMFLRLIKKAENDLRELIDIPDDYKILFLQGCGSVQFSAVPMNLIKRSGSGSADYIITGYWSAKAAREAAKYGKVNHIIGLQEAEEWNKYSLPDQKTWKLDHNASYVYFCSNDTVSGFEFSFIPETNGVPLVCDMSSNILTKKVDVSKFGLIFAETQINLGISGVTIVIVREDLLNFTLPICPAFLDYKSQINNKFEHNTPATLSIYTMGLVLEWLKEEGGVQAFENINAKKSKIIYKIIDSSDGFYYCPTDIQHRSRLNIPFRIGSPKGNDELEKLFVNTSTKSLEGHRSTGGVRTSLYNAISKEETEMLANFMKDFQARNKIK